MMSRRSAIGTSFLTTLGFLAGCGGGDGMTESGRPTKYWSVQNRKNPRRIKMLEKLRHGYPALPPPESKKKKKTKGKISDY